MSDVFTIDLGGTPIEVQMPENTAETIRQRQLAQAGAASASESASFAEEFSGPAYDSIEDGEAATTPGQFFRVPVPSTDPVEYTRYQRTAGGSVVAAPLATTVALSSSDADKGAALVRMRDGATVGDAIQAAENPIALIASNTSLIAGSTVRTGDGHRYAVLADDAADYDIVTAAGKRLRVMARAVGAYGAIYSAAAFGAVLDGIATTDIATIQKAIDRCSASGGGEVNIASGSVYVGAVGLMPKDNVTLTGSATFLLKHDGNCYAIRKSIGDLINFHVRGLRFDGSDFWPEARTISRTSPTVRDHRGVFLTNGKYENISVEDCYFHKISGGAVAITTAGARSRNIRIRNNAGILAAYGNKIIAVYGLPDAPWEVEVSGNWLKDAGPLQFTDAGDDIFINSQDGIHLDVCDYSSVTGNWIVGVAGIGVRIEECFHTSADRNHVIEPGQTGVMLYNTCRSCTAIGNIVTGWGRIPAANSIRNYGGAYYYATEYVASCPADPSADARFALWPYALTGVDTGTIRAYAAGQPLQPYRGEAAVSMTTGTTHCTVTGNSGDGNLTQASGKYLFASDYGYTCVHPINTGSSGTGNYSVVEGNSFRACRRYAHHHPQWMNPVGASGDNGMNIALSAGGEGPNLIGPISASARSFGAVSMDQIRFPSTPRPSTDPNTLDTYAEGVAEVAFAVASGSITIDGTYDQLMWTKIGRVVHCTGQLRVSAISSPSGAVTVTGLPFAAAAAPQAAPVAGFGIAAVGFGGSVGDIYGLIAAGASVIQIVLRQPSSGNLGDTGAIFTTGSQLSFSFHYHAGS